jgi:hypothetical protein
VIRKRSVSVAQLDDDINKKIWYLPYKCFFPGNQISQFPSKLGDFFLAVLNFHDPEL